MSGLYARRPLMVNNLTLSHCLFKSHVINLIEMLNKSNSNPVQKWILFASSMQNIIRQCGKYIACKNRAEITKAQDVVVKLKHIGNMRQLHASEESVLVEKFLFLNDQDKQDAAKARFLSRKLEISDSSCMAKGFFRKLNSKRCRESVASICLEEGQSSLKGKILLRNV